MTKTSTFTTFLYLERKNFITGHVNFSTSYVIFHKEKVKFFYSASSQCAKHIENYLNSKDWAII